MNGTPIFDIKPYIPTDCRPEASGGFTDRIADHRLKVVFPEKWLKQIPGEIREALTEVLENDPRPGYQSDPDRVYGIAYGGKNIRFRVAEEVLTVCGVEDYRKTESI